MTGRYARQALAALVLCAPLGALDVATSVNTRKIDLGQAFHLTIRVDDGELDPVPSIPEGPYDVGAVDIGSRQSISIIGLRETVSTSKTYSWAIRPHAAGTCTVPAFPVTASDGKTYRTQPVVVTVRGPQDNARFFLEVSAPRGTVYPTQEITVTLTIFAAAVGGQLKDRDPFPYTRERSLFQPQRQVWPDLTIPWLGGVEGLESSDYHEYLNQLRAKSRRLRAESRGFTINGVTGVFRDRVYFPLPRRSVTRTGPDGVRRTYYAYTLSRTFRGKEYGEHKLPPVIAKGYILVETASQFKPVEVYTLSNAATVRVAPPPEDGRPPSYSGAIGVFRVKASAAPTRVKVGDPIKLELHVAGEGDLDHIGPVRLGAQEGFDRFKVYGEPTAGEVSGGGKLFVYTIRAAEQSIEAIPPIKFSFFDPKAEAYVTVQSETIPLTVEEGETFLPQNVVEKPVAPPEGQKLKETGRGIRADYRELDALLPTQPFRPAGSTLLIVGLVPPLFYLLLAGLVIRHRAATADPIKQRARSAASKASGRLKTAAHHRRAGDGATFYPALSEAILGFVADRTGAGVHGFTRDTLTDRLAERKVPEEVITELTMLVDRCDAARFSPGETNEQGMTQDYATAAQLLKKLGRIL